VLRLEDSWVWDFWLADDGRAYHMYFLKARRSLGDPDLRHFNVAIGHAASRDLIRWAEAADVLAPAAGPAFDDIATWTGSVVRGPDGTWFMFYTGCTGSGPGLKQRIGLATSADLYTWRKHAASPVLESDRRWYEQFAPPGPARRGATRGCSPIPPKTAGTCWSRPGPVTAPSASGASSGTPGRATWCSGRCSHR
jgi:beta-fructofuranosidase